MMDGLAVAMMAPTAGLCILLVPRGQRVLLGAARTFALAAALCIVVMELVPSAVEQLGVVSLLLTVAAMVLPGALSRVVQGTRLPGVVLSALGLAVHQLFDGAQMGAASASMGLGVVLAVAAHGGPLVAVAVLAAERQSGRRNALLVGLGLVLATVVGFLATSAMQGGAFTAADPWFRAAIAGFLLHVVGHDMAEDLPEDVVGRTADLAAAVLGFAVVLGLADGGHVVEAHAHHGHDAFGSTLWALMNSTSLVLLLGLVLSAAIHALGRGALDLPGVRDAGAGEGAASGASLAVQTPSFLGEMLPAGRAMAREGLAPAALCAFLIALPAAGAETLGLSVAVLGGPMASARLGVALLVAMVGGAVFGVLAERPDSAKPLTVPHERDSYPARWAAAFDELLHHVAPQVAVGLVVSSYLLAFVHTEDVPWLMGTLGLPVVSLLTLPLTVVGGATVPVAEVLWSQGMSSSAVLAGLVLGPGLGVGMLALLREVGGTRATVAMVASVVALTWMAGLGLDAVGLTAPHAHAHPEHGAVATVPTMLLAVAVARAMFLHGPRAWLAGLWGIDSHDHGHAHGESHAHG